MRLSQLGGEQRDLRRVNGTRHPPSAVHGAGSPELHVWYAVLATQQHDEELQHLLVVVPRVAVAEQRDPLLQKGAPLASEAGRQLVGC